MLLLATLGGIMVVLDRASLPSFVDEVTTGFRAFLSGRSCDRLTSHATIRPIAKS